MSEVGRDADSMCRATQLLRCSLNRFGVACSEHDPGAFGYQDFSGGPPEAAGPTADHVHPSRQAKIHA